MPVASHNQKGGDKLLGHKILLLFSDNEKQYSQILGLLHK